MKHVFAAHYFLGLSVLCLGSCTPNEAPEPSLDASELREASLPEEEMEDKSPAGSMDTNFKRALILAHQAADEAKDRSADEKAAKLLEEALSLAPLSGEATLILRQDLSARAGSLRLRVGDLKTAELLVRRGLSMSEAPSAARAQLFIVLADVEEARGHGDAAKQALLGALSINQELFERELEEP